ncbi:MAG: DNA-processing protein DprA [Cyclobacteriaceae bacterium]
MTGEKLYQVALTLIPGIGDITIKLLISYLGSPDNVYKASKSKLNSVPGVGPTIAEAILKKNTFSAAKKEISRCKDKNIELLFYTDLSYPERLKQMDDAPALLYFKGNADLNTKRIVGIVGTRKATAYGKSITQRLVEGLAPYQPLIVSGLAYGIDIQAHRISLKSKLPTIGVLGSSIDVIYPAIHKDTCNRMVTQGGLLSENKLGTKPDAFHFPARNRIIAGLSDALVVVEAAKKGGALITAHLARRYKKKLFAMPGSIEETSSEGCHNLIKKKQAHLLTGAKDLTTIMGWDLQESSDASHQEEFDKSDFSGEELKILSLLSNNQREMLIDDLSWKSQIPINRVASLLLTLEFSGWVKSMPGKKYVLSK